MADAVLMAVLITSSLCINQQSGVKVTSGGRDSLWEEPNSRWDIIHQNGKLKQNYKLLLSQLWGPPCPSN